MDTTAVEAIRAVKHRYLRGVDLKRWDDVAATLTQDTVAEYGTRALDRTMTLHGADAILGFLREHLDNGMITVHLCGQHEITVDGDTAHGSWAMQDTVISPEHGVVIEGTAYYEDDYRHTAQGWRIRHTGYLRLYETMRPFDTGTLLANRWSDTAQRR